MRNHDQFFLKPFQIDSRNSANKFELVCKLAACKFGQNGVCQVGNECSSRYSVFNQVGRRRRQADNANDVTVLEYFDEEDTQQV